MSKYCFGVDVGGTTVKMGLFTPDGDLLEKWEIPTRTEEQGAHIIDDIAEAIDRKIKDAHIDRDDVIGVGVGVPGPVNKEGIVFQAVNLGWGVVDLRKELHEKTGFRVKAGNDANVAALGEQWKGGGKGYDDMVLVTLGTGVGGGIIVNGKMLVGVGGAGGEIGHIHLEDEETEPCGCGNYGCMEQYASATGIVRLAKRKLAKSSADSVLRNGPLSAKHIWDAIKDGDALAVEVAEEFGEYLGKGLAIIADICNPKIFVLGGGVSKAGDILITYVQKYYKKYVFHASRDAIFTLAVLENDAGIYGAAKLILD
ncbi:MAG: ROK family glucokinase [Lachnospiraceae bacterium]|nr:ROK family glucokinase [Lachnospiraceae bacterium]